MLVSSIKGHTVQLEILHFFMPWHNLVDLQTYGGGTLARILISLMDFGRLYAVRGGL